MIDKLTYKRKKQALIVLLVLLTILGYKRIGSKTINQAKIYLSKNDKKGNLDIDKSLSTYQYRVNELEELLGKEDFDEFFIQHQILEFITKKANENKVELVSIQPSHFYEENEYLMVTNHFVMKGEYNKLIKTIFDIETKFKTSKMNSLSFYVKKNYSKKKNELLVKLLFQNFKKK